VSRTIGSLQAGRGLAALAVVLHHAGLAGHDFGGPFVGYDLFLPGYLGVDYFFVLSGFIIYHSTVGVGRTPADYLSARFRRVYLPYWPVGLTIALLYVLLPTLSQRTTGWSWLPTLTLAPVDASPALSVAWTLKHEILFYGIFGLFYFARLLPLGLAAWAVAIIAYGQHLPFAAVNLEFFFGIAAVILYRTKRAHPALFLLAPIFVAIWVISGADPQHRVWMGAAFACVVAPLAQIESRGLSVPAPLVLLGAISYSLYLVHEPVISVTARLLPGSWPIFFGSVVAAILAGFAYHFAIEARVIKRRANPEVFTELGGPERPPRGAPRERNSER